MQPLCPPEDLARVRTFAAHNGQLSQDGQFVGIPTANRPGSGLRPVPRPSLYPGTTSDTPCDAQRVVKAGGALVDLLMHPAFTPLEQLFRKLPVGGVFEASPQHNFTFELGSFEVPASMAFALVDYRFDIYRPSGAAAADPIPIEERRLSTHVGYAMNISEYRRGQVQYQLTPSPPIAVSQSTEPQKTGGRISAGADFAGLQPSPYSPENPFPASSPPQPPTATDFNNARANAAAATGGQALSLLPQRTERQGALDMPFTYVVEENQRLTFKVSVFDAVPIPLSFFEVSFTGFLLPTTTLAELYKGQAPCGGVP